MDDYVQTVLHSYPAVLEGMPRIAAYDVVYTNWIREIEGMIKFGNIGSSAFHPQIAGTPGRAIILEHFCKYLAENRDIWCTTCKTLQTTTGQNWRAKSMNEYSKIWPEGKNAPSCSV